MSSTKPTIIEPSGLPALAGAGFREPTGFVSAQPFRDPRSAPAADMWEFLVRHGLRECLAVLDKRIVKGAVDECWPCTGYHNANGYARVKLGQREFYAHRVMWAITNRTDPAHLIICHSCDNPVCCNPAHLWLGTQADNARDRDAKGRARKVRRPRISRQSLMLVMLRRLGGTLEITLKEAREMSAFTMAKEIDPDSLVCKYRLELRQ